MTREEVLSLEDGRILDELIAKEIMGETIEFGLITRNRYGYIIPEYSSNISDAWQVVEKLPKCEFNITKTENHIKVSMWRNWDKGIVVEGESLPLLICQVALLSTL